MPAPPGGERARDGDRQTRDVHGAASDRDERTRDGGEPPQAPALAHERHGSGPPLVLLHPLGADRHVWRPVIERLNGARHTISVDLPGFGESPPLTDGPPTPAALARAVAQLLRSLGVSRPQVAGNSLGGWVALELALQVPCASVTAIAPAGLWPAPLAPKPPIARTVARAALPLAGALARTAAGRSLLLAGIVGRPAAVPGDAAFALVRAYALAPGFASVNAAMRAGRFTALSQVPCPVTLVWPERDRLVRRPRSLPEGVRQVVIRGAGHVPMWDAPDELAQILLDGGS
ncbi:MAG TPA: alpha/beta fold hydrolase [Solirubrobacteraceae bacterium]|nr:alpha/beta fold hydrolase [Solirubrobacteraceae bacterium]